MTDKRFTLKKYTIEDYAILDNGIEIAYASNKSAFTFCELLNELHEENQALKTDKARYEEECRLDVFKELSEENERLKQQLLYDGDDVCGICKHEYLVPSGDYFIGKCKKGHKECSKEDIKYCEDFELIQVDFNDLIKRMDKELEE